MKVRTKGNNPECWIAGEEFDILVNEKGEHYIIEGQGSIKPGRIFNFEWDYEAYMKWDFEVVENAI